MAKLEGKIALVTGGSSGIGLATAKQFVNEGAYVFITGRREAELAKAAQEIGRNITAVRADASNLDDLDRLFTQIKREKGRLDVVFANAGVAKYAPLGAIIALGHFSKAVMRLHFYLDRDFAPYWKWLPHEFRKRGYSPPINEQLLTLPGLSPTEQSSAIQWICGHLRARLPSDGVVPGDIANPYNLPWFFRFREEILKAITDPEIRKLAW
jgi:hypothetical protein